jgi:hypothetical protein
MRSTTSCAMHASARSASARATRRSGSRRFYRLLPCLGKCTLTCVFAAGELLVEMTVPQMSHGWPAAICRDLYECALLE